MRQRPRHEVARVVVHEADQVHALMATQLEREDVALPHLIWLGAFEPPRRLVTRCRGLLFRDEPSVVKDAAHGCLGDAEPLKTREHIADSSCSPVGVRFARFQHCSFRCLRGRLLLALGRRPAITLQRAQRFDAPAAKQRHEFRDDRRRYPECNRGVRVRRASHHRLDDADADVVRDLTLLLNGRDGPALLSFLRHLFLLGGSVSRARGREVLCERQLTNRYIDGAQHT